MPLVRRSIDHLTRPAVVLIAALLTGGCGDDDGGLGPGEERVGPAGGEVATEDGDALVRIPPGALDAPTLIEVRRLEPEEIPPALEQRDVVSEAYRFGPDGLVFDAPVRVEIYFDAELLPAGVELEDLTLGRVDESGEVQELSGIEVIVPTSSRAQLHVTRRGIGGQVSSFSPFAVWVDDTPGTPPGITSFEFPDTVSNAAGTTVLATVGFRDREGDVVRAIVEEVSDPDGAFVPNDLELTLGGATDGEFTFEGYICPSSSAGCIVGTVTLRLSLEDARGNRSDPITYTFTVAE
ncbi:MAG TPA: hypothetical protein VIC56_02245 [Gemmatimonadota bacterium]|jgi:hypothetical protein